MKNLPTLSLENFLDESGEWKCIECGACCLYSAPVLNDPSFNRGDGGCIHLGSDMRCGIYKKRPPKCVQPAGEPPLMIAQACLNLYNMMRAEIEIGRRSAGGVRWKEKAK